MKKPDWQMLFEAPVAIMCTAVTLCSGMEWVSAKRCGAIAPGTKAIADLSTEVQQSYFGLTGVLAKMA